MKKTFIIYEYNIRSGEIHDHLLVYFGSKEAANDHCAKMNAESSWPDIEYHNKELTCENLQT